MPRLIAEHALAVVSAAWTLAALGFGVVAYRALTADRRGRPPS